MKTIHYISLAILAIIIVIMVSYRKLPLNLGASLPMDTIKNINRKVDPQKMLEVCERAGASYLLLEMYPIKHSRDNSKEDFDIMVYYRDANGPYLSEKANGKDFEGKVSNYFSYLKGRNVDFEKVPLGYELYFRKKEFCKLTLLEIQLDTKSLKMDVFLDSCRYPPGCDPHLQEVASVTSTTVTYDSCRFPPGCRLHLLEQQTVKHLLESELKHVGYSKKQESQ